jgi:hypothetical protein
MEDSDSKRTAILLIKRHGDDAEFHAAQKVDALMEEGDMTGAHVWKGVLEAVEELRSRSLPKPGSTIH